MLDSLVRVSRRVKFEILINSYFLLAMLDECGPTWCRFNTNTDLEYLPPINERWVYFRQLATLLWSPRLTDIAYILIADYGGNPEDVSSIKSFISQLTVIKSKMPIAVKSAENTTNQTTVCSLYVTNWSHVSFNNQVQPIE
jgi:hypothetical protein